MNMTVSTGTVTLLRTEVQVQNRVFTVLHCAAAVTVTPQQKSTYGFSAQLTRTQPRQQASCDCH